MWNAYTYMYTNTHSLTNTESGTCIKEPNEWQRLNQRVGPQEWESKRLLRRPGLGRLHQLMLVRFSQLLLAPAYPLPPPSEFLCLARHHYWLSRGEIYSRVADNWVSHPSLLLLPLVQLCSSRSLWPDMEHEKNKNQVCEFPLTLAKDQSTSWLLRFQKTVGENMKVCEISWAEQRKMVGIRERLYRKERSWTELCNKAFCLKRRKKSAISPMNTLCSWNSDSFSFRMISFVFSFCVFCFF